MSRLAIASAWCIVIGLLAFPTYGQETKPKVRREPNRPVQPKPANPETKPGGKSSSTTADATQLPTQATVEMIMNEAVKNIARRYNLNEAQKQKTDEIMKREVNKFLKEHEEAVWPIIRDLIASNFGANAPKSEEELKRIGKAAEPLLKLAKDAIYKGNDEWRKFLNEEQKVTHDYDMREMDKSFGQIEQNFHAWAEGKHVDGGIFPPPPADQSPPMPRQPKPGLPEPEVEIFIRATLFDTVVEEFIKENELDPAQIDAAKSILTEFKQKAADFKEANRAELTKVAASLKSATDSKDLDKIASSEAERKKLLQPVYELFPQMDERLKGLLTTTQLTKHASRQGGGESKPTPPAEAPPAPKSETPPKADGHKPAEKSPESKPVSSEQPAPSRAPAKNDQR